MSGSGSAGHSTNANAIDITEWSARVEISPRYRSEHADLIADFWDIIRNDFTEEQRMQLLWLWSTAADFTGPMRLTVSPVLLHIVLSHGMELNKDTNVQARIGRLLSLPAYTSRRSQMNGLIIYLQQHWQPW